MPGDFSVVEIVDFAGAPCIRQTDSIRVLADEFQDQLFWVAIDIDTTESRSLRRWASSFDALDAAAMGTAELVASLRAEFGDAIVLRLQPRVIVLCANGTATLSTTVLDANQILERGRACARVAANTPYVARAHRSHRAPRTHEPRVFYTVRYLSRGLGDGGGQCPPPEFRW